MDLPNALIGQVEPPSEGDVAAKMGPAMATWNELLHWLNEKGITSGEWR